MDARRRMGRWALAFGVIAGTMAAWIPAAQAKGDMVPTSGSVVITGPGLAAPIARAWRGSCFVFAQGACSDSRGFHRESQGFPADLGQVSGPFWRIATQSNFLSQVSGFGRFAGSFRAPVSSADQLGPKYHVTWSVTIGGTRTSVQQDLYPYGPPVLKGLPGVPWSYTAQGQTIAGNNVSWGWMPMLPTYFDQLVTLGLPATAPPMPPVAPPPLPIRPVHVPAASPAQPIAAWPVALGIVLLLGATVLAAAAGRPRPRVRAA